MGIVTDYQPGVSITIADKDAVETIYLLTETTILLPTDLAATLAVGDTVAISPVDPKAEVLTAAFVLVQPVEVLVTPEVSVTPVP